MKHNMMLINAKKFIIYNLSFILKLSVSNLKTAITKKLHRTDSPPQYADVIGQTKINFSKKKYEKHLHCQRLSYWTFNRWGL